MNRTAITLWSLALLAFLAWPASAQETFYFSDFESDDGGWVLTSAPPYDSWEHGTVVPGVHEGCDSTPTVEPAGAHSGTNVWATNLDGCYPNTTPTGETVLAQTFDFSAVSGTITLSWWHYYEIFETFDRGLVEVNDVLVWETPDATPSSPDGSYIEQTADLSAFAGNPNVTVEFILVSTTVVNRMGWYIDDVEITADNIPVELTHVGAQVDGRDVTLTWETASETNNAGFEVQMRQGESWSPLGFVGGHGTTTEAQAYAFQVRDLLPGTYTFRLKQIDFDGAFEYSPEVEAGVSVPTTHLLTQAYPNPFNPQARFDLAVAQSQHVDIALYNVLGQRVASVFNGPMEANQTRTFTLDAAAPSAFPQGRRPDSVGAAPF